MHPNEESHRAILAAFTAGDAATASSFYTEDAVFHVNGRGSASGDHRGFGAFMATFAALMGAVDSYSQEVHDVVANDRHSIGLLTTNVTRGDRSLTSEVVTVLTWREGKVVDERIIVVDTDASDDFYR